MKSFITKILIIILGLVLAERIVPGIEGGDLRSFLLFALLLVLVNTLIRPLLFILTLPITIITLGFFVLVLNAFLFGFVASLVGGLSVSGFTSALLGSLVVSVVSMVGNTIIDRERLDLARK